ncbi:hypothetical protein BGP77_04085 [Saccharospirillum sp. MSK14-1]|uniref:DUF1853 family protein n=1 Tax=Saccharospirillum sp. MSK14-1 TaxID=1897632 RepID=UPI000D45BAA6|nr:DUF1853 family protein [Saccharospirillum sp. MSK14-1]PTY36486.1 hypothetical protein BGP77_04085 [Saccharospirillum sp. MSK14-1]
MNEAASHTNHATTRADLDWVQQLPALLLAEELAWRPVFPDLPLSNQVPESELAQLEQHRHGRLGAYFEALAAVLLTTSGRYRLLASNRIIQAGQRTLGEMDLLVEDQNSGEILHLELALKFYLAAPIQPGIEPGCQWIGAGLRDFLTLKMARLENHQRYLPQLARDYKAWPADLPFPDRSLAWVLGRGFVRLGQPPSSLLPLSQQAPLGNWITISEFQDQLFTGQWINKANWLADQARQADAPPKHPLPNQFFGRLGDGPQRHWFVVPDAWPEAAQARILERFGPGHGTHQGEIV